MSQLIKRPLPFQFGLNGLNDAVADSVDEKPLVEVTFEPCPAERSTSLGEHGDGPCPCCYTPVVRVTNAGMAFGIFSDFLASLGTNEYTGNDLGNSVFIATFLDGKRYQFGYESDSIFTSSAYLEGGNQTYDVYRFSRGWEWTPSHKGGKIYSGDRMPCICVPKDGREHTIALEVFFQSPSRAAGYPETRGFGTKVVRCCSNVDDVEVVVKYRPCKNGKAMCTELTSLTTAIEHSSPFSLGVMLPPRNVVTSFDTSNCCADIVLVDRDEFSCVGGYRITQFGIQTGNVVPNSPRSVIPTSNRETVMHTLEIQTLNGPVQIDVELFDQCGYPIGLKSVFIDPQMCCVGGNYRLGQPLR